MLNNLGLMVDKNLKLEFRSWRRTLAEIFVIVVISSVLISNVIKRAAHNFLALNNLQYTRLLHPMTLKSMTSDWERTSGIDLSKYAVAFSPPEAQIGEQVADYLHMQLNFKSVYPCYNSDELDASIYYKDSFVGLKFHVGKLSYSKLPDVLNYTLRYPGKFRTYSSYFQEDLWWATKCGGLLQIEANEQWSYKSNAFLSEGFIAIQDLTFRNWYYSLIHKYPQKPVDGKFSPPKSFYRIIIHPYIHRNFVFTCHYGGYCYLYEFCSYFIFLIPFCNIILRVSDELNCDIMPTFWKYNTPLKVHWIAHFLVCYVHLVVIEIFFIIIIKIPWIRNASIESFVLAKTSELAFYLLLYNVGLILTAFLIAFLVVEPVNAVLVGITTWIGFFLLFFSVLIFDRRLSRSHIAVIFSIFFNNSIAFTLHFLKYHLDKDLINIKKIYTYQGCFIGLSLILFIVVQFVTPENYGNLIMLDIFQIKNKFKRKNKAEKQKDPNFRDINLLRKEAKEKNLTVPMNFPSWHHHEYLGYGTQPLLELKNVYSYLPKSKSNRCKLINISLKLFPNIVAVLLGHNNSGKTTLMKICAGLEKPLFGSVLYEGKNIANNWQGTSATSDILLDKNPLFGMLSSRENLDIFIFMKGRNFTKKAKKAEAQKWISAIKHFIPDTNVPVMNLTYGQQRVLSLCCTMCCNTKIVLLDQPTKLMILDNAFIFWQLVKDFKKDRAIVLTTVRNDVAQSASDTILFLENGILIASGTIFFFRTIFQMKMQIIITKMPYVSTTALTNRLKEVIGEIELDNEVHDTVIYRIPKSIRPRLQYLLLQIELSTEVWGIQNMHVLDSEASEVFTDINLNIKDIKNKTINLQPLAPFPSLTRRRLFRNRLRAISFKKLKQRLFFLIPMIFPPLIVCMLFIVKNLFTHLRYKDAAENLHTKPIIVFVQYDPQRYAEETRARKCNHYKLSPRIVPHISRREYKFTAGDIECISEPIAEVLLKTESTYRFGAVEFRYDNIKDTFDIFLYVNLRHFYSAPILLNMFHNMMLMRTFNTNQYQHPLVLFPLEISLDETLSFNRFDLHGMIFPLVMAVLGPLILSCFILLLMEDKVNRMRLLLEIAGLSRKIYLVASMVWDCWIYFLSCIAAAVILTFVQFGIYLDATFYMFLLMVAYGFNCLPCIYFISIYVKKSVFRAYFTCVLVLYLLGSVPLIIYWEVAHKSETFFWAFCLSPSFAALKGMCDLYIQQHQETVCLTICEGTSECDPYQICAFLPVCCGLDSAFTWNTPGIMKGVLLSILGSALYICLLIWVKVRQDISKYTITEKIKLYRTGYYDYYDPKVIKIKNETAKLDLTSCLQCTVCVDQVEKTIPQHVGKLNTVSFQVQRGECLCVYGACQSGKTHLALQLVGKIGFRFGEIYMVGEDIRQNLAKVREVLGYCPQKISLFPFLTIRQHLQTFCMVRGIPKESIKAVIEEHSSLLNLRYSLEKYPNEVKLDVLKKVNVAISFIVNNEILILDEPTIGLPSVTRHEIWNAIAYQRNKGAAVIIFTIDSLECKRCAHRVMMIDNYEMLSYDTIYSIRSARTKGLIIEAKFFRSGWSSEESNQNLRQNLRNFRKFMFFLDGKSLLLRHVDNYVKYFLPREDLRYSFLYGVFEKGKLRLNIKEYYIHYFSVEDIMLGIKSEIRTYKAEKEAYMNRQKTNKGQTFQAD